MLQLKTVLIVYSSNNIIAYNNEGLKLYKKQEGYELGGTCYSLNDQITHNKNNYFKDQLKLERKEIVDSIHRQQLITNILFLLY